MRKSRVRRSAAVSAGEVFVCADCASEALRVVTAAMTMASAQISAAEIGRIRMAIPYDLRILRANKLVWTEVTLRIAFVGVIVGCRESLHSLVQIAILGTQQECHWSTTAEYAKTMPRLLRARRGAAKRGLLTAIVLLAIAIVSIIRKENGAPGVVTIDSSGTDSSSGKYVSSVDEGLGASIALVLDVSGSMRDKAAGDNRAKYLVARDALRTILATTDEFVARQPDFPVNVGLYTFSDEITTVVPVARYNRGKLEAALAALGRPDGGTAIGDAMNVARADLYKAGTFRKYILVVTDGANTNGRDPEEVAREIAERSEGAVRQYFVAFDIDKERFAFLKEVNGDVLGAADGLALRAGLDSIYRGKILAEAMNAGETQSPARRDSGGPPKKP